MKFVYYRYFRNLEFKTSNYIKKINLSLIKLTNLVNFILNKIFIVKCIINPYNKANFYTYNFSIFVPNKIIIM